MDLNYVFRRLVFAQVLLGVVAFCIAEQNPEILLVAGAMVALSWYVVEGPTGKPLPQWSILLGAMLAVGWLLFEMIYFRATDAIRTLGHFTIWLQVLQLYGQKNNRDYTLLLVLSLLQMVGATVLSASPIFGFTLIVYCTLALFTVLMFQFKSTSDLVYETTKNNAPKDADVDRPKAVTGRGYRWQFRILAIAVGTMCGIAALAVFLLVPRGERSSMDTDFMGGDRRREAGFSPKVQLGMDAPPIASRTPVLHFKVSFPNSNLEREDFYYLRGAVLDHYIPGSRTFIRGDTLPHQDRLLNDPDGRYLLADIPPQTAIMAGEITHRSGEIRHLFTTLPIVRLESSAHPPMYLGEHDLQLLLKSAGGKPGLTYRFQSPLAWDVSLYRDLGQKLNDLPDLPFPRDPEEQSALEQDSYARGWPVQAVKISNLALQVLEQAGVSRDIKALNDPNDGLIAIILADYLRDNFTYSLVNNAVSPREDPIAYFLFRQRQGHCESFASAFVAMCRSIGMQARVITGFLAHDYNRLGGYFIVRRADAHSWAEVYTPDRGWVLVDPTPPDSLREEHWREPGWTSWIYEFYDHLEYSWITNIVGYDQQTRDAVVTAVGGSMHQQLTDPNRWTGKTLAYLKNLIENWRFDSFGTSILSAIVLAIALGGFSLVRLWIIRRRRLVALQLTRLPRKQRLIMVKRLSFYLVMLDMLERHGFERPNWQSPFAFAHDLTNRNPLQFEPVLSLTEHFYEIRFGHRDLDPDRRKLIRAHLSRLEETLGSPGTKHA